MTSGMPEPTASGAQKTHKRAAVSARRILTKAYHANTLSSDPKEDDVEDVNKEFMDAVLHATRFSVDATITTVVNPLNSAQAMVKAHRVVALESMNLVLRGN